VVDGCGPWSDHSLGEIANGVADRLLIIGENKGHFAPYT
jgi:hypothetical protein